MITREAFLNEVKRIADSRPTYRTGCSGKDGTCDCIGLIMGAMVALGHERYDLHSTNYFARYQMTSLERLTDESQLFPGAIVYKDRVSMDRLHERYQYGGRYFTGDLLDYYHVGVVTGVDPLEIIHCTSTETMNGIAYDNAIGEWSHFGMLLDVDYGIESAEQEGGMEARIAIVHTDDGNPVKMRSDPSTKNPYIAKVPNGAMVDVLESADGWATVRWNGMRGYMMSKYLYYDLNTGENAADEEAVTVTMSRNAAAELYKALGGVL